MTTTYHALSERGFSYVAVSGSMVELKIGTDCLLFNIQTAEELIDILTGYVQDYREQQTRTIDLGFRPLADFKEQNHGS